MTPEEINRTIAEACGWKQITSYEEFWQITDRKSEKRWWCEQDLPDYYNDLNAMHEAEKELFKNFKHRAWYLHRLKTYTDFDGVTATAPQRCEAFLRTIGKWRDSDATEPTVEEV